MSDEPIRILHLSDFHMGKDDYGQEVFFPNILNHVAERTEEGKGPELVVITGDIAQSGNSSQYVDFCEQFLKPLKAIIPENSIFIVPGNHDVDRNKAKIVHSYNIIDKYKNFFDPTKEGMELREPLHPRFKAYVDNLDSFAPCDWVTSEKGFHTVRQKCGTINIAILHLNTAWLSADDDEQLKLRLDKDMVSEGLDIFDDADLILVLGHHPLNWLYEGDASKLETLFAKRPVIYLSGHIHKGKGRVIDRGSDSFLTFGCGAGFQAREDDIWVNGFQWYELEPHTGQIHVEPLYWHAEHQEWHLDTRIFPNNRKSPNANFWTYPIPGFIPSVVEPDFSFDLEQDDKLDDKLSPIVNPYNSLKYYDINNVDHFFGRNGPTKWAVEKLVAGFEHSNKQPIVRLEGASRSG